MKVIAYISVALSILWGCIDIYIGVSTTLIDLIVSGLFKIGFGIFLYKYIKNSKEIVDLYNENESLHREVQMYKDESDLGIK